MTVKIYDLMRQSSLDLFFLQSYSQYSVVMAAILNFAFKIFPQESWHI